MEVELLLGLGPCRRRPAMFDRGPDLPSDSLDRFDLGLLVNGVGGRAPLGSFDVVRGSRTTTTPAGPDRETFSEGVRHEQAARVAAAPLSAIGRRSSVSCRRQPKAACLPLDGQPASSSRHCHCCLCSITASCAPISRATGLDRGRSQRTGGGTARCRQFAAFLSFIAAGTRLRLGRNGPSAGVLVGIPTGTASVRDGHRPRKKCSLPRCGVAVNNSR